VGSPIYRLAPPQASDGQGSAQKALDLTQPPLGSGNGMVTTGSTANFQYWYRDPQGGGSGFNLSNGLSVTFVL
jgi:hypothetical protein